MTATFFTQSVDPGMGTSSTSMPSCLSHPSLAAMAKGAAAAETVRAHQPTLSFVTWALTGPVSAAEPSKSATAGARATTRRERDLTMR